MLSAALFGTDRRIFRRQQFLLGVVLLVCAYVLRSLAVAGTSWQVSLEPTTSTRFVWTALMVVPTMVHVAAISIVTVSILRSTRLTPLLACGFWAAASVLLECFEHEAAQ